MIAHTVGGESPFRFAHLTARGHVISATRLIQRDRQVNHPLIEVAVGRYSVAPGDLPLFVGFEVLSRPK